jgi:hypothetical protein
MGHGKSTKEKEVEQSLKWGSAPNPVPASLRLRRQYGRWLVLVGWFWLVWTAVLDKSVLLDGFG